MEYNVKNKTLLPILAALFTALMAVFAQIQIPTPFFPLTLQTFAVALCGYTLGVKYSLFSVLAYMLLGVCGAPVFSSFCGGPHHFTDPQGGFLIAFPVLTLFCALAYKFKKPIQKIGLGIAGVAIMYVCGAIHFMLVTNIKSITVIVLMFFGTFIKDILLVFFGFYISRIVKKRIFKNGTH
ncbi:MAG: biotin transporter BioY [Clostridia bacterium]|nr:biotin transporter BioY [Clostridia bacterium]